MSPNSRRLTDSLRQRAHTLRDHARDRVPHIDQNGLLWRQCRKGRRLVQDVREHFYPTEVEAEIIELESLVSSSERGSSEYEYSSADDNSDSDSEADVFFEAQEHQRDFVDSSITSISEDVHAQVGCSPCCPDAEGWTLGIAFLIHQRVERLKARMKRIKQVWWSSPSATV